MRVMPKILITLFAGTVIGLVPMFAEQAEAQRFGGRGGGVGIGGGRVGIGGGGGIGRVGIGGGASSCHRRLVLASVAPAGAAASPAPAGAARVLPASVGVAAVLVGPDVQAWPAPPGGADVQA